MAHYNTVLSQLLNLIPRHRFDARVRQLQGDRYVKNFSTWNQLTVLLFAQAGGKMSLRDIQNALNAQVNHLYHLGLPSHVARSTLADANASRDYRIYEDLFYQLKERCQAMAPRQRFKFKNPLYILDSTTIERCLSAIPWARKTRAKGAIKLHYGFDYDRHFPALLTVSTIRTHDITAARKNWTIIPDSINCFDRGYVDYEWFRRIHDGGATFVTRARKDLYCRVAGQQKKPENSSVTADRAIALLTRDAAETINFPLRLVSYFDKPSGRLFRFLTNNFDLDAQTVADIYKARWEIEAFFKWIKQNLKIKTFLGTSKNAVLTQIWVAMCYYLLLAYIKFQSRYDHSLFYLHRLIGQTLLDRLSLIDLVGLTQRRLSRIRDPEPQLGFSF